MNKLNSLIDSSFINNESNEENTEKNDSHQLNQTKHEEKNKLEKILCNHCGRTTSNGIRCLGICVSDNEY